MLSTTKIKLCFLAISAQALMSVISIVGLEGVSIYSTFVFGFIAEIIASISEVLTKEASTLNLEKSCSSTPLAGP